MKKVIAQTTGNNKPSITYDEQNIFIGGKSYNKSQIDNFISNVNITINDINKFHQHTKQHNNNISHVGELFIYNN